MNIPIYIYKIEAAFRNSKIPTHYKHNTHQHLYANIKKTKGKIQAFVCVDEIKDLTSLIYTQNIYLEGTSEQKQDLKQN